MQEKSARSILILSALAAVLVAQAFVLTSPARALDDKPDDKPWMTNGRVYATALSEDGSTLYIGGRFTQVRENPPGTPGKTLHVSNVAAINVAGGAPIEQWNPQVTGEGAMVHSLAVGKDGRVFIGGTFTAVGGEPRQNLAVVAGSNGAVRSFAPAVGDATSVVRALLADDSRLYVGGNFSQVDGEERGKLAAFDLATDTLDPAWRPKANGAVRDLEFAVDDKGNSIFVAGAFSSITGSDGTREARQSVARLFTDTGNLHPWKIPSGTIENPMTAWDITATPTRLYGGFGRTQNYAAAFHLDREDHRGVQIWRFKTTGNVQTVTLSLSGSRLFIGGHFGIANREQRVCGDDFLRGLGILDPNTGSIKCKWLPRVEGPVPNYEGIRDMAVTSSYLWVGGGFTGISRVEQMNLARFTI